MAWVPQLMPAVTTDARLMKKMDVPMRIPRIEDGAISDWKAEAIAR
jgi:hypothetical protein